MEMVHFDMKLEEFLPKVLAKVHELLNVYSVRVHACNS